VTKTQHMLSSGGGGGGGGSGSGSGSGSGKSACLRATTNVFQRCCGVCMISVPL